MDESTVIIKNFVNGFKDKGLHDVVLYGLGKNSKTILDSFSDFHCLGLMDGFQENGEYFGYPILSKEKVAELHPEAIIIVARKNSTRIIAKRIEEFCRTEKIALYDMEGEDLLQENLLKQAAHPYFQKNVEQLWQEIEKHHVVSFDIFDTLLMRQVLYPEDVFSLVEQHTGVLGFAKCRQTVERNLYREGGQPTLSDIYHRLQESMKIPSSLCRELYETELSLEEKILLPRRDMVEIFRRALQAGKRVWLISDMYLPSNFLARVCRAWGIDGWEKLVVSCEYGVGKTQGLFQCLQKETNISVWLHIGDSREADDAAAEAAGLDVFPICSALDMVDLSSWQIIARKADNLAERFTLGVMLAQVLNSPFALAESKGRPILKSAELLGYNVFGPVLTALFYWLKEQLCNQYDVILWGARDGYLLNKMQILYQKLYADYTLPKSVYFYTSRMVAMAGYPTTKEDIIYMAGIGFAGNVQEMLMQRFRLLESELLPLVPGESTEEYVLRHESIILARAKDMRDNILKYWNSLKIKSSDRIAFFDLVSSGTCHLCTQKIVGRSINGFYLIHVKEDYKYKEELKCISFIEENYLSQLASFISSNYEPLETVAMSFEPSLLMFDKEGKKVFGKEKRTTEVLDNLRDIHKGVIGYFKFFIEIWGTNSLSVRTEFVDVLYSLLRRQYTNIQSKELSEQIVTDDFTNREFVMMDMFD